ncbi:MAG TPA: hypothetical protein VFD01_11105, partial [Candidatus Dormibacteraeota bacterium]|nr:hypothetical protein [Candidatus Dormibacteraeota bacterium]
RVCRFGGNEDEGTSRPRRHRDATCPQAAFRARRQRLVVPAPPGAHRPDALYECGSCGERLLNEQRGESCLRFARRLGVAVTCTSYDEPMIRSELLEQLS